MKSIPTLQKIEELNQEINPKPITPWLNLKTIDYLREFLTDRKRVFEFGAGRSTIFFSRVAEWVTSVETRQEWVDFVASYHLQNSTIRFIEPQSIAHFPTTIGDYNEAFDLVLIDSRDRLACLKNSLAYLKPGGVIVVDNCERSKLAAQVEEFAASHCLAITKLSGPRLDGGETIAFACTIL